MDEHTATNKEVVKYSFYYANEGNMGPVNCGQMQCTPNHRFGPNVRSYYIVHFVFSGKGVFYSQNGRYDLTRDWCFIIRPGERNTYEADAIEPWNYAWLGFTCEPCPSFLEADILYLPQARPIFEKIRKEYISYGKQWYILSLIGNLFTVISEKDSAKVNTRFDTMMKAKTEIENSFAEHLNINELAYSYNMDRSYFSKSFKRVIGFSPKEYQTKVRMDNAAIFLRNPSLYIGQIALDTGYPDVISFSKAFRKHFNCSPTEYRKRFYQE